jgi:hypothetical protein
MSALGQQALGQIYSVELRKLQPDLSSQRGVPVRRKLPQISCVVTLAIATLAVTTNVSAAQITSSHLSITRGQLALRIHNTDGSVQSESVTTLTAAGEVVCDATVDNPHYSRGGGTVIFKTRVTCRGRGAPVVQVRITGTLGSIHGSPPPSGPSSGPPVPRATSDQTQDVAVNGGTTTYYTPMVGSNKVRGSSWYNGDISGQIVGPPGIVTTGPSRAHSHQVWVNDPG